MALSPWSAPVTATTPPATVTLVAASVTHEHRVTSPAVRSLSAWSAPVTATTPSGAVTLVPANVAHGHYTDGDTQVVLESGYGELGYGEGGYGGVTIAAKVVTITVVSGPIVVPPPLVVVVEPTAADPAPATWAFSIGSWRTGPSVPLTQATNRRVTWRLIGRSEASFELDGTDEAALAIDELVSDLWVTRSPVPDRARTLFRGRVGRTQDSGTAAKHTVSVSVGDYRAVLDGRQLWDNGQLSWVNVDQAAIAWGLIQHTQAQPGGALGIKQGFGTGGTGITRIRNDYPAGKKVGEALDQLSQVSDGFDWDITPAADPRDPTLALEIFYPVRGTDRQAVLAFGDRVVSWTRGVNPDDYANAERGTGAEQTSAGAPLAPVRREATDIATRPEGRWDGTMADPDLSVQQTIVERTEQELARKQVVTPDWVVTLKPNDWRGPDDIWIGDPVIWVCKSGRLNVVESLRAVELTALLGRRRQRHRGAHPRRGPPARAGAGPCAALTSGCRTWSGDEIPAPPAGPAPAGPGGHRVHRRPSSPGRACSGRCRGLFGGSAPLAVEEVFPQWLTYAWGCGPRHRRRRAAGRDPVVGAPPRAAGAVVDRRGVAGVRGGDPRIPGLRRRQHPGGGERRRRRDVRHQPGPAASDQLADPVTGMVGWAAGQSDGQTVALWVAVLTLAGGVITSIVTGGLGLAGKRGEVRQSSDAGLRDDQREFISTLQADNRELRARVAYLERGHVADQQRIAALEQALRDAGIKIPQQVALPAEEPGPL